MKIYEKVEDIDLENPVMLTGFRPSAPSGNAEHTEFTLGHLVQVQQLKNLQQHFSGGQLELFVILADNQGVLDNPTPDYQLQVKRFTMDYSYNILACLHDLPDAKIFRESKVYYDVVLPLSYFLQTNLAHNIITGEQREKKNASIINKFGKEISYARLGADIFDQAAHAMGADANLIPAGKNQMLPFEIYNKAIQNYTSNGYQYAFNTVVNGMVGRGYLLGPDGKKMSTSKGNGVGIETNMEQLENIFRRAESAFIENIIFHFGDTEELPSKSCTGAKSEYAYGAVKMLLEPIQERLAELRAKKGNIEETLVLGENSYKNKAKPIVASVKY